MEQTSKRNLRECMIDGPHYTTGPYLHRISVLRKKLRQAKVAGLLERTSVDTQNPNIVMKSELRVDFGAKDKSLFTGLILLKGKNPKHIERRLVRVFERFEEAKAIFHNKKNEHRTSNNKGEDA